MSRPKPRNGSGGVAWRTNDADWLYGRSSDPDMSAQVGLGPCERRGLVLTRSFPMVGLMLCAGFSASVDDGKGIQGAKEHFHT